ncbi:hypothetical protein GCM10010428_60250 [Actinosynnema pretiosum subsp. pretiosum]
MTAKAVAPTAMAARTTGVDLGVMRGSVSSSAQAIDARGRAGAAAIPGSRCRCGIPVIAPGGVNGVFRNCSGEGNACAGGGVVVGGSLSSWDGAPRGAPVNEQVRALVVWLWPP